MNNCNLLELLNTNKISYMQNALLKDYTSFKIGGPAEIIVTPNTIEKLIKVVMFLKQNEIKYFIIGKGSNLLFSDSGYNGVIIKSDLLNDLMVNEDKITAGAGVGLSRIAKAALEHSLGGFEFAALIPGSLGGAIYMNAGAYCYEMADIITSVSYIDESGTLKKISNIECDFSYRHSYFTDKNTFIVKAEIKLSHKDKNEIYEKMKELSRKRSEKQPLEYPSAGSTFKRPKDNYAGALIEKCGLKGYSMGDAQVSEKHAGFIINKKSATFNDVISLINYVKTIVKNETNIDLEEEVKIIY